MLILGNTLGLWVPWYMQRKSLRPLNIINNIVTYKKWYDIEKIGFQNIHFFASQFSKKSVGISEHIRHSTPYRLYANGCPEYPLSNHGSGIAKIILRVEKISPFHSHLQLCFIFQHFYLQIMMRIIFYDAIIAK